MGASIVAALQSAAYSEKRVEKVNEKFPFGAAVTATSKSAIQGAALRVPRAIRIYCNTTAAPLGDACERKAFLTPTYHIKPGKTKK